MPIARKELVSLDATPYYHVVSRCVRRAFLCGTDHFSGQSYEHRKEWILSRLTELSEIFAVDICAYAIMSNHLHLVVRLDPETAAGWSESAVMERWAQLFSLPLLVARYKKGETRTEAEDSAARRIIEQCRERLSDLSWFMRCLNEPIARQANAEDGCTGRFWEGRFKSQALLDEAAILTCMAYADLNPVRAGMAKETQDSDYTSVQQRIQELIAFKQGETPDGLPFSLDDYIDLVDWSGRVVRDDKRGAIDDTLPSILERLEIDAETWQKLLKKRKRLRFHHAVGRASAIKENAASFGRAFLKGLSFARELFSEPALG